MVLKRLKLLVPRLKQRRAGQRPFLYLFINFCSIKVHLDTVEHNCSKDSLSKSLPCIWQHCLQTPICGRDWKQDLHQYQLSHPYLTELAAVNRTLTASQVTKEQKNLHPLFTHIYKCPVAKTLPLGKKYTPFLWTWILFHLREKSAEMYLLGNAKCMSLFF